MVIDHIIKCERNLASSYTRYLISFLVTIQTGLLTVLVAVADIIFYLTNVGAFG